MTGSGPKLGVLLLLAVLLQTVVVTITVLHFTTALNSVRKSKKYKVQIDEPETHRGFYASLCSAHHKVCASWWAFERTNMKIRLDVDLEHLTLVTIVVLRVI